MVKGFSKLTKGEKLKFLAESGLLSEADQLLFRNSQYSDAALQSTLENVSENVISNFHLPYSIAPNFLINGQSYVVPMVTEESSVVAAAASAAGFWAEHGGFICRVMSTEKCGQIFFEWNGPFEALTDRLPHLTHKLLESVEPLTAGMKNRGGGITDFRFQHHLLATGTIYELHVSFETVDSMGANFINSCLELLSERLRTYVAEVFTDGDFIYEPIMAILSNHTPNCTVECFVECHVEAFNRFDPEGKGINFAMRFKKAVDIALCDPYRAVTHNKGIFNGISAVLLATGNDFRAVEAAGHAYAVKHGRYASLTTVSVRDDTFRLSLVIPLAIGTVGGLTALHPHAAYALRLLRTPNAEMLMMIMASAGLASNFAAIKALITEGIQQGHMKMHLVNILNQLGASEDDVMEAKHYFVKRNITVTAVRDFLTKRQKDGKH